MGVSRSCVGGTVRTAYRVHGGASARTRDAYIYISGDEVVHTASIMYEPNAYQASQQLDTMESVRERSRAISKLADSGHTVRGYIEIYIGIFSGNLTPFGKQSRPSLLDLPLRT